MSILLAIRATSLETRKPRDERYENEYARRSTKGKSAFFNAAIEMEERINNPEQGFDIDDFTLTDDTEQHGVSFVKSESSSRKFTASVNEGKIVIFAQWGADDRPGEDIFMNIFAKALLWLCHHKQVDPDSIQSLEVLIVDDFLAQMASKVKLDTKKTHRFTNFQAEFYAVIGGEAGDVINKFRPMGQRYLRGDGMWDSVELEYDDRRRIWRWNAKFERKSVAPPPYCDEPPAYQ